MAKELGDMGWLRWVCILSGLFCIAMTFLAHKTRGFVNKTDLIAYGIGGAAVAMGTVFWNQVKNL